MAKENEGLPIDSAHIIGGWKIANVYKEIKRLRRVKKYTEFKIKQKLRQNLRKALHGIKAEDKQ